MKTHYPLLTAALLIAACTNSGGKETPANSVPNVTAGADQSVQEGSNVTLSSSLVDTDGDASVSWTQISGPMITLNNPSSLNPTFRAPVVSQDITMEFEVTAADARYSDSDRTVVTVMNVDRNSNSSQGIDDDSNGRRNRARNNRDGSRPVVEAREVRRFDGSENNVANPLWGASFIHLQRFGASDYSDGISEMAGTLRPSAREVSNAIINQDEGVSIPNSFNGSDFVWQWGQFIDHDIDLTDGGAETADISVPSGDEWFDPDDLGDQLIFFSRALYDDATGTDVSNPREQENEITSWIDGSMIYGSSEERATALRANSDGALLDMSAGNLLPFNTGDLTNANGFVEDPTTLFVAGDVRVNEQVGLTVMHTLFMREHNRLAMRIMINDPGLSNEEVFQQARRLVVGKLQKITYEDWLPVLLGPGALTPYSGYDDTVNGSIFNEFSVAAYRLGHSMINEELLRLDASGNEIADGHLSMAEAFFTAPSILTSETSLDPILRGLAAQPHQTIDAHIIHDLRNFLFGEPGLGGLDLASLNIQRGRDHGVPSYNDARVAMGLAPVTGFNDITSDTDLATALSDTYSSVDDIDLWVGGLAEDPFGQSQLGELFHTILVSQFTALRDGDRFWYENDLNANELDMVRRSSLSEIIRDNTGIGGELQANVFLIP